MGSDPFLREQAYFGKNILLEFSLSSTQSFSFLFRSELEGHVQHGYLKLEPSVFDEKWIGVSGLRFRWIYEWVGRPFLRSCFKELDVHSIPTPLPLQTMWSMDMLLSLDAGRFYLPVFAIPKLWVSDLVLQSVPTPFIGGQVQESFECLLPPGIRTSRSVDLIGSASEMECARRDDVLTEYGAAFMWVPSPSVFRSKRLFGLESSRRRQGDCWSVGFWSAVSGSHRIGVWLRPVRQGQGVGSGSVQQIPAKGHSSFIHGGRLAVGPISSA